MEVWALCEFCFGPWDERTFVRRIGKMQVALRSWLKGRVIRARIVGVTREGLWTVGPEWTARAEMTGRFRFAMSPS